MVAYGGLPAATKDGQELLSHLLMDYYIANPIKKEDPLGMKRVSQTFTPCRTCFSKTDDFPYIICAKRWTLRPTSDSLYSMNKTGNINAAEDWIRTLSRHSVLPVSNSPPFIGTHPWVVLYTIYRPDTMHTFHYESVEHLKSVLPKSCVAWTNPWETKNSSTWSLDFSWITEKNQVNSLQPEYSLSMALSEYLKLPIFHQQTRFFFN